MNLWWIDHKQTFRQEFLGEQASEITDFELTTWRVVQAP